MDQESIPTILNCQVILGNQSDIGFKDILRYVILKEIATGRNFTRKSEHAWSAVIVTTENQPGLKLFSK